MPKLTESPNFEVRPITPDEWKANAIGALALPPGFWEGPGANLEAALVTPLGAFVNEQMVGYLGIREVPRKRLTTETGLALRELLDKKRTNGELMPAAYAALEDPQTSSNATVAYNVAYALTSPRGQGVGSALSTAAVAHINEHASPERPMPAYICVAAPNPEALDFFTAHGAEPLTRNGEPYTKMNPYHGAPDAHGNFAEPVTVTHQFLGAVFTGAGQVPPAAAA